MIGLSRSRWSLALIAVTLGLAVLSGIASAWFSPYWALAILGTLAVAILVLKRPEIGLLAHLILTSTIVDNNHLPRIPIGVGKLYFTDIVLLALLGSIIVRALLDHRFIIIRAPLDWPILGFVGVAFLSTFIAINQSRVTFNGSLGEIRVIMSYLTFFVVTNLVRKRRQLEFLINGLLLLASMVALAMISQFVLGTRAAILPGRVETLNTQGITYEGVTRIAPPGLSLVLVSLVVVLCTLALEHSNSRAWLKFAQCGLLGMALLVTFLRSYWAVLIVVVVLLVFLLRGVDRQRLVRWGLLAMALIGMLLLGVGSGASRLVGAATARFTTLLRSGTFEGQDGSVAFRYVENSYALPAIASHPLLGLGTGTRYRPWDSRLDSMVAGVIVEDYRGIIHNGHLRILLQSGVLGYLAFAWFSIAFLARGFSYWRRIANNRMRGVVLGSTLVYLAVLIAALTNSIFTQWNWTPVLGIIFGVNEVVFRGGFQAPEQYQRVTLNLSGSYELLERRDA